MNYLDMLLEKSSIFILAKVGVITSVFAVLTQISVDTPLETIFGWGEKIGLIGFMLIVIMYQIKFSEKQRDFYEKKISELEKELHRANERIFELINKK